MRLSWLHMTLGVCLRAAVSLVNYEAAAQLQSYECRLRSPFHTLCQILKSSVHIVCALCVKQTC